MTGFKDLSIRDKAILAIMSTTIVGLLVSVVGLLVWDALSARPRALRQAMTVSDLVAAHLDAPLSFHDRAAAQRNLQALGPDDEVVAACVFDRRGTPFASFRRPDLADSTCPSRIIPGRRQRFERGGWTLVRPVTDADETVGHLHLRVRKTALSERLLSLLPVFGIVGVMMTGVSLWLSTLFGRALSAPLLNLAREAGRVSEGQMHGVPLPVPGADEVGRVTEAFNDMVGRVRERERDLAQANSDLAAQMAERQRAENQRETLLAELRVALRVRDEFLSIASHELRTPISTIMLQAGTLHRLASGTGELPRAALAAKSQALVRQAERMERLIGTLLDVSRIVAGKLVLTPETLDLTSVVVDTVAALQADRQTPAVDLRVTTQGPVTGCWDRLRIEQIVTNLIGNAIKYGQGRPIDVIVEADPQTVRLIVRDRGLGIAPEHIQRIFGRFERAVSERHYGGLGLGLWIVRQIVDAMRGRVHVESEPGVGSTFLVELPR